jgi:hypothetical protein
MSEEGSGVVHRIAQIFREYAKDPEVELEFRLGRARSNGTWSSNIGFDVQDSVLARCGSRGEGQADVLAFSTWAERCDHYHSNMRTRIEYDGDSCSIATVHARKVKLARVQFRIEGTDVLIRLDASREQAVDPSDVPDHAESDSVHITHYCAADYKSQHDGTKLWRYDAAIRWSGSSRSEAEKNQRSIDYTPDHVLELEYIGTAETVERYGAERLVVSGIIKLMDMVGATGSSLCDVTSRVFDAPP